jgi:hypothetical protein
MKTYGDFNKDSIWALDRLDEEGFKNAVARRKKRKRSSFLSARQQKIKDLKDRPLSWQGLE